MLHKNRAVCRRHWAYRNTGEMTIICQHLCFFLSLASVSGSNKLEVQKLELNQRERELPSIVPETRSPHTCIANIPPDPLLSCLLLGNESTTLKTAYSIILITKDTRSALRACSHSNKSNYVPVFLGTSMSPTVTYGGTFSSEMHHFISKCYFTNKQNHNLFLKSKQVMLQL
mmetsp:Transcript_27594/g.55352  ORF Transcript_27594/g.55352 Transcript_27594/m.55352 type:complete len:172 (-) Transcript_27594:853-1368(-)